MSIAQRVERGSASVDQAKKAIAEALKRIRRVKELADQLGAGNERLPLKERYAEALALSEAAVDQEMTRRRGELQAAMTSV